MTCWITVHGWYRHRAQCAELCYCEPSHVKCKSECNREQRCAEWMDLLFSRSLGEFELQEVPPTTRCAHDVVKIANIVHVGVEIEVASSVQTTQTNDGYYFHLEIVAQVFHTPRPIWVVVSCVLLCQFLHRIQRHFLLASKCLHTTYGCIWQTEGCFWSQKFWKQHYLYFPAGILPGWHALQDGKSVDKDIGENRLSVSSNFFCLCSQSIWNYIYLFR